MRLALPMFRCRERTLVALLGWLALGTFAALHAQMGDSQAKITLLTDERSATNQQIVRLASDCDTVARRLADRRPPLITLYLAPGTTGAQFRGSVLFVGLEGLRPSPRLTHLMMRIMLYRLAMELNERQRDVAPAAVPDWLVSAACRRLAEHQQAGLPVPPMVALRLQAQADRLPPWRQFVDHPCGPAQPWLWLLYCDSAEGLLQVCQRTDAQFVPKLLRQLEPKLSPAAHLANLLPEQLTAEGGQTWLDAQLRRLTVRADRPGDYESIRARLTELEQVTIMVPDKDGAYGIKKVLIEQVPDYLARYDYDRQNTEVLLQELFLLIPRSPYLLRESLAQYAQAINHLRQGQRDDFVKTIRAARARFAKDYAYGMALSAYLDQLDVAARAPGWRLLQAAPPLEHPSLIRYEKQVGAYLDRLSAPGHVPGAEGEKESAE